MPFGSILGAVAGPVLGAVGGSVVSGLMSPSASGGSGGGGSYYVPSGLSQADQQWQGLQTSNANTYYDNTNTQNQIALQAEQAGINNNNLYGNAYQNAANSAGQQYGNLASAQQGYGNTMAGYGSQLGGYANQVAGIANQLAPLANVYNGQAGANYGTQQQLLSAGQQVYQNSLDPQKALYNRSAQQLQDQTGATNSMYGLGSSAAGAGVANQAMSNFNIDWNAQQLQNQIAGLGAYNSAASTANGYGQLGNSDIAGVQGVYSNQASAYGDASSLLSGAANQYNGAANMFSGAAGNTLTGGQIPYSTGQSIAATPGNLANTYGSYLNQNVYGPAQSIQQQAIPYMNAGIGAQSLPYQNAYNNAQATGGAVGSAIQGLGSAAQNAGSLGNMFSGTTGSFGSGDFSGAFNSSPYYSGGGNSYGFTM